MFDLAIISNLALDTVTQGSITIAKDRLGGPPFYAGGAAASLGLKVTLISKIGYDFPQSYLSLLRNLGINLDYMSRSIRKTTRYLLNYRGEERSLKLLSSADKIKLNDITMVNAKYVLISPIAKELTLKELKPLIDYYKSRKSKVMLDIQGFVRRFSKNGLVSYKTSNLLIRAFKDVDLVKMSNIEQQALLPNCSPLEAIMKLRRLTRAIVVVTLGPKGCLIGLNEGVFHVPSKEILTSDTTGAGDVFAGAFTYYMSKIAENPLRAACFSSAYTSFFLELKDFKLTVKNIVSVNKLAEEIMREVKKL